MTHSSDQNYNIQILLLIIKQGGECTNILCSNCQEAFDMKTCPERGVTPKELRCKNRVELAKNKLQEYNSIQFSEDEPQIILNQEY
jgi:hypothetical protein